MDNELSLKASREELASTYKKMEDLENRAKRNNIVIWGLKEGAEATHNSLEDFLRVEFFEKHMQLQEYPSDPLRKISALQTKVKLAGNLSNKQNLAENLANREIASWKKKFVHKYSLHFGCTDQFWLKITFRCDHCEMTEVCNSTL